METKRRILIETVIIAAILIAAFWAFNVIFL